jgi:nucleotide-binding universal stress UspA family protein
MEDIVLKTILVPLDGSALAERALPYAQVLARVEMARIVLVRAVMAGNSPASREATEGEMRDAKEELVRASAHLEGQGIRTTWLRPNDEAGWGILNAAKDEHADLIVMSTHGRTGLGRWFYGSVAERVLRGAQTPILLVPSGASFNWPADLSSFRTIVPLDGSLEAEEALSLAVEISLTSRGELVLAHAPWLHPAALEGPACDDPVEAIEGVRRSLAPLVTQLAERRIRSDIYVSQGLPHEIILDAARIHHAHLIIMATHARDGLPRLVLGSVAHGVVRRTPVAVLLVRPEKAAEGGWERSSLTGAVTRTSGRETDSPAATPHDAG